MTATISRWGAWESAPLVRAGDATATWAAGLLVDAFGTGRLDGLYVATSDAGASESVEFWRSALATGLRFAGPQAFPWTLANSPTGRIAESLGVRGPTYTLVGGGAAMAAAAGHALDDLARGLGSALLAALDGVSSRHASLAAVELVAGTDGSMRLTRETMTAWTDGASATATLRGLVAAATAAG